jgi:hypothetical protein
MNRNLMIALGLAAVWSAGTTAADAARDERAKAPESTDVRFDALDRNHDGFLSRDEANEAHELDTRFSELDANNDGKLSREEYRVVGAGETATLPGAPSAASEPPSAASGATRP